MKAAPYGNKAVELQHCICGNNICEGGANQSHKQVEDLYIY